jgi:hypothetical protein
MDNNVHMCTGVVVKYTPLALTLILLIEAELRAIEGSVTTRTKSMACNYYRSKGIYHGERFNETQQPSNPAAASSSHHVPRL